MWLYGPLHSKILGTPLIASEFFLNFAPSLTCCCLLCDSFLKSVVTSCQINNQQTLWLDFGRVYMVFRKKFNTTMLLFLEFQRALPAPVPPHFKNIAETKAIVPLTLAFGAPGNVCQYYSMCLNYNIRCCNHAHLFLKISSYLDCMPQRLSFCCLFLFLFCFLDLQISYFTMFFYGGTEIKDTDNYVHEKIQT